MMSNHPHLPLVQELADLLQSRQWMLATAESCTGGWVAKCCTDLEGSSGWFDRGFVTYTNAAKQEMLGVSDETLAMHGAVSEAVVRDMASGVLQHSKANLSVAISGIAGPGGGSPQKPVGTVWFAWGVTDSVFSETVRFEGNRDAVRSQAVTYALEGLIRHARP